MAKSFLRLPADEKQEVFDLAAQAGGQEAYLLEKDVWVVWAIRELFAAPFGKHLVFKGGTSLSKGYDAIQRFSEDIDLTYDIREIIPEMVGDRENALPPTPSQGEKWSRAVRARLPEWIVRSVVPVLDEALKRDGLSDDASLRVHKDKVFIDYTPLTTRSDYVKSSVILEFGARSTGEPFKQRDIVCDIAEHLEEFVLPKAAPRIMLIERTCWEKALAVHVYCLRERSRNEERFARHWYDLARLDAGGYMDKALQDNDLAMKVAQHQSMFFIEKDANRERINYEKAVSGELVLVPGGEALKALKKDYSNMIESGFLQSDADPFEDIMDKCREIEKKANCRSA